MARDHFYRLAGNRLLVPGCGYGRNSLFLAQSGFRVTAFDVSSVAIGLAQAEARLLGASDHLEYFVADLLDDAFLPAQPFDGIFLSNVIHLSLKPDRERMIRRLSGFLAPGGILAFTCISTSDVANYGIGPEVEPNTFMKHTGKPLHFFDADEIDALLATDYALLARAIHTQTETDPGGQVEHLQLWFVAAQKRPVRALIRCD